MANFCHQCAQPVTTDMRACPNCGTKLVDLAGATAAGSSSVPFSKELRAYWRGFRAGAARLAAPSRYTRAPIGPRFGAALIDAVIGWVPLIPAMGMATMGYVSNPSWLVAGGLATLAALAWGFYYTLAKDGWGAGQSIGKRQMGVMVVHLPTNRPCTRAYSAYRSLVMLLCMGIVPGVGWLIEPVVALAMENGRRLGDHAADTQVIAVADYAADAPA